MPARRWVDFAEKIIYVLLMRIDLHCHTKYSHDNYFEPQKLIEQAIKMNLDGVCIAERFSTIHLWAIEILDIPPGFHVFTGVEISTKSLQ